MYIKERMLQFLALILLLPSIEAINELECNNSASAEFNCTPHNNDPENCFHSKFHFEVHSRLEFVDLYSFFLDNFFYVVYKTDEADPNESKIHWDKSTNMKNWADGGTESEKIPAGTEHLYVSHDKHNSTGYFKESSGLVLATNNTDNTKDAYTIKGSNLSIEKTCSNCVENPPDAWITPIYCNMSKRWYSINGEEFIYTTDLIKWEKSGIKHGIPNSEAANIFIEELLNIAEHDDSSKVHWLLIVRDYTKLEITYYVFHFDVPNNKITLLQNSTKFDYGPDFQEVSAVDAATYGQDHVLIFGTTSNIYVNQSDLAKFCWSVSITIPRYLALIKEDSGFVLYQSPYFPPESGANSTKRFQLQKFDSSTKILADIRSKNFKLFGNFTDIKATEIGFNVLQNENYKTPIVLTKNDNKFVFCLDRSLSKPPANPIVPENPYYREKFCAPFVHPVDQHIPFFIIVDGLSVEALVHGISITAVVFSGSTNTQISPIAVGGDAQVEMELQEF